MIAIVGGGITGLSLAHHLVRDGAECTVLEARDQVGGVIRSRVVEGHLLDWGPQRARLTADLRALIEAVGLQDDLRMAPTGLPLFVYRDGRLRRVPFSVSEFLRSDVLSLAGKARLGLEPFTAGADPGESVARFFTRKLGRQAYETLVGPLYGGLYASDPADMVVGLSLGHVLKEFRVGRSLVATLLRRGGRVSPPPACSFRDGMQMLPLALARSLGGRVRASSPVRALEPDGGGGWVLGLDDGKVRAESVVLTAPAPATSALLAPVAPDAAERIGGLRYNPLGVVHIHAETDLVGLGFQVSLAESLSVRGVTYNDSLFGRAGVYTVYVGGAKRPEAVDLPDDELAALAIREFELCTGFGAEPLAVERERMPAWDATWAALQRLELPPGLHIAANWMSRPGIPGRLADARRTAERLTAGVRS